MTYPKAYLYQRIVQAKLFIDENYMKEINVELIADEANYSKYHFIRLFKTAYGYSPRQYLILKRIELAKYNLTKNSSVSEACYSSGFTSIGTFSTLFKDKTGSSPNEFKKAKLKEIKEMKSIPEKYIPGCFIK